MTLLYDSTNPNDIPAGVFAAGYVDGIFAWPADAWARFSSTKRIAVFASTNDGDVLDVERYDATPDQAPDWVQRRRAAGVLGPWVYCNRSNRPLVEAALAAAGLSGAQVALWVATLDGTQDVAAGPYPVAAVQYANSTLSGGHYDLSIVNALFGPGGGSLGDDMTPEQEAKLDLIIARIGGTTGNATLTEDLQSIWKGATVDGTNTPQPALAQILTAIKGISSVTVNPALTPNQAAQLQLAVDILERLEVGLKAA